MTKTKRRSSFAEVWQRLRKNTLAMVALVIICLLLLVVIFADLIVPYSAAVTNNADTKLLKPCAEHWFGCDNLGRDLFARVIHGARVSLLLGFGATVAATVTASRPYLERMASMVRSSFSTLSRLWGAADWNRSSCTAASSSGIRLWAVRVMARMGAPGFQLRSKMSIAAWNSASFHTPSQDSSTVTWAAGGSGTASSSGPTGPAPPDGGRVPRSIPHRSHKPPPPPRRGRG